MAFPGKLRQPLGMEKQEHGRRLKEAIGRRADVDRQVVADKAGVKTRTVTNWTSGETMPTPAQRDALRELLGDYDADGDAVEVALANSALTEDRRYAVLSTYKRHLREQSEGLARDA
jgi:transcriptional regulator with XRE-family HTH domain